MREFLEAVLPSSGWYVAGSGLDGANEDYKQRFFNSIDGVETYAKAQLAKNRDVFFAVASYKEPTAREQSNVLHLKALFQDFDLKSQSDDIKHTADLAARIGAACAASRIPRPTVVSSGGGYHCYWTLQTPIPPDVWMVWNLRIAAMFAREGVTPDSAVRKDCARILRVPETTNFKRKYASPLPVSVLHRGKDCTLESFHSIADIPVTVRTSAPVDALTASLAGSGEYPKCDFTRIVRRSAKGTGCAQILRIVSEQATVEEPLWRAGLSIAQVCEDRDKAIHQMSKGHPDYTPADTEEKAAATKGPYTCETFRNLYAAGCVGCAHAGKITSPVILGRIVKEADITQVQVPKPVVDRSAFIEPPQAEEAPVLTPTLQHYRVQTPQGIVLVPKYLYPYFRGENGGVHVRKKGKGDDEDEVKEVCPYDYYMTHTMTDEATGDQFGVFRIVLPQDGVREMVLPMNECGVKDRLRDRVADKGMPLMPWQLDLFMEYTIKMVRDMTGSTRAQLVRSGMGWTAEETFVVGEKEYLKNGTAAYCPSSAHTRALAPYFKPKGSLDEWKKIANVYAQPGYELHAFTLFMGFGAPLLRLMNVDGGIISLVSPESGTGKTTAQFMVNSIFGHPKELLLLQKDTVNSKVQRMGAMRSIACCVDEVTNMTGTDLSEFVYGATQGRGKHRMEAASNMERVNTTKWQLPTITSSNRSLTESLLAAKMVSQAELSRIVELSFEQAPRMDKREADELYMHRLFENYGVAGEVYIPHILKNLDRVRRSLAATHKKVDEALDLDSSKRFWSALITAALCGGTISRSLGLHDIDLGKVFERIKQEMVRNVNDTAVANTDYNDVLGEFINQNINNVLVSNADWGQAPLREPKGRLVMRYEPTSRSLFIPVRELRAYCAERQVNMKAMLGSLSTAGIFTGTVNKRLAANSMAGIAVPVMRCHQFNIPNEMLDV